MPSTLLKSGQHFLLYCIGATSSTREELTQFITAISPFHPALKYPWEISNTSLAFLDIKISIEGNGLGTSVHYKPTDSHSYLLYLFSHPSHVNNFIPFSQFLELCHSCSDNSDFSEKIRGNKPVFQLNMAILFLLFKQATMVPNKLLNSQQYKWLRRKTLTAFHSLLYFTLTTMQLNLSFLKNFKLLQNNSETGTIFSQPPIISLKCDKNIRNQWPVWNCQMRLLSMQNMSFN